MRRCIAFMVSLALFMCLALAMLIMTSCTDGNTDETSSPAPEATQDFQLKTPVVQVLPTATNAP